MRRSGLLRQALLALLAGLLAAPAQAHKASDSQLSLQVQGANLSGHWDIALLDLELAVGLDANGDGAITWGELRARHAAIAAHALARLAVQADGQPCSVQAGAQQVDEHSDGAYTVLPLTVQCPRPPQNLSIGYRLLAELDAQHRGLLRLADARGRVHGAVLVPTEPPRHFALASAPGAWATLGDYFVQGVWHIAIGFDHILFLLCLLLPAVLRHGPQGWQPLARQRDAAWEVLRVVTAFTVAHSITLAAATLGWLALPSRWVEAAIAASVVLAALNNLRPLVDTQRWALGFGFGLVHGFGFASVLADLGLPQGALALALLGFNLGVEGGQLALVAAVLPPALWLARRHPAVYRRWVLGAGSLLIAALAALWLAERALGLQLL